MTQLALAEALGITFDQLQQYQTGRHRISARGLQKIASILGIPVSHGADGKAGRARTTDLGLFDSAGAMRLMRAYAALPTPRLKRALVHLAERMAGVGT